MGIAFAMTIAGAISVTWRRGQRIAGIRGLERIAVLGLEGFLGISVRGNG
jgi:hypothetical protein